MPGDARRYAAAILEKLQQTNLKNTFCCYGTQDRVLIGIGRDSSLKLNDSSTFDAVWTGINAYLEANANKYIFGFIGFDPANQLHKKLENYRQKIDLFVPDSVIECTTSGYAVVKGSIEIETIDECPEPSNTDPIAISDLDLSNLGKQYAKSASHFINAIQTGTIERATLARKINSQRPFDLSRTFIADYSRHQLARSFYFSNEHIAFAGQCPEVLAEGNIETFETHKLSGTHAKDNNLSIEELSAHFLNDHRIIAEHQSAITAIEHSLLNIGKVQSTKFEVMALPTLLHGWSRFVTHPAQNVTVAKCLRSVFPFGVNPVVQGFELLAQHEDFCRGPYYGLTGYVSPDGEFSFTQVLRSAFIDHDSSYLMVGAAITSHSTAELEMTETCDKLSSIQVFERDNQQQLKSAQNV